MSLAIVGSLLLAAGSVCADSPASIDLVNRQGESRSVLIAELDKLPVRELTAPDPHTREPARYRGVALFDVLSLAGVATDTPLRGNALATHVLVHATDGYLVAFSLAELDPRTGSTDVILAFERDGEPMSGEPGPFRLVTPTDRRGARWVRQVSRIQVLGPRAH